MRDRSARIQPMRMPPQAIFDIEPTVTTRGSYAAIGVGAHPRSMSSSVVVSSTIRVVPALRAVATRRDRSSSGSVAPVGLWKSGIR